MGDPPASDPPPEPRFGVVVALISAAMIVVDLASVMLWMSLHGIVRPWALTSAAVGTLVTLTLVLPRLRRDWPPERRRSWTTPLGSALLVILIVLAVVSWVFYAWEQSAPD